MKQILLIAMLAAMTSAGHGQTLITDNFDRGTVDSPENLAGTSPDYTATSTTSENWVANYYSPYSATDGTEVQIPFQQVTDYLNIPSSGLTSSDLTAGSTYTLSFSLTEPTYNDDYVGFGSFTNPNTWITDTGNTPSYWASYTSTGNNANTVIIYANGYDTIATFSDITGTAAVVLNVSVGANNSDTLSGSVDGTTFSDATPVTLDASPQIAVGGSYSEGAVLPLSLVEAAPEPRSWALLLGGLGMLVMARRFRSLSS